MPGGCAGVDTGFRDGHLHPRGPNLGSADVGRGAEAYSVPMLTDTILFYIFALMVLAGAVFTITRRSAIHSAISLIVSLLGVAGAYPLPTGGVPFRVLISPLFGGQLVRVPALV